MRLESGSHHHTPIAQLHAEIRSPPSKKNKKPHREGGGRKLCKWSKTLGGGGSGRFWGSVLRSKTLNLLEFSCKKIKASPATIRRLSPKKKKKHPVKKGRGKGEGQFQYSIIKRTKREKLENERKIRSSSSYPKIEQNLQMTAPKFCICRLLQQKPLRSNPFHTENSASKSTRTPNTNI